MATENSPLLEQIRNFQTLNGDWRALDRMISDLCREPLRPEGIDALLAVLERFPTEDGAGVLWSIVHALEDSPLYPAHLLASLRRRPVELSVVMVNRMLNAGQRELAGTPAIDVLLEVANRADVESSIRAYAKSFVALPLVLELEKLLQAQGERNHIRGVTAVRQALESRRLADARSIYRTLCGGNGTFSDYNIWHDDFHTRSRLNEPLDRLRDQLWAALME